MGREEGGCLGGWNTGGCGVGREEGWMFGRLGSRWVWCGERGRVDVWEAGIEVEVSLYQFYSICEAGEPGIRTEEEHPTALISSLPLPDHI